MDEAHAYTKYKRVSYFWKFSVLQQEGTLEPAHFIFLPVNKNDVLRIDLCDETSILNKIYVRREAYVVYETIQGLTPSF